MPFIKPNTWKGFATMAGHPSPYPPAGAPPQAARDNRKQIVITNSPREHIGNILHNDLGADEPQFPKILEPPRVIGPKIWRNSLIFSCNLNTQMQKVRRQPRKLLWSRSTNSERRGLQRTSASLLTKDLEGALLPKINSIMSKSGLI